MTASTFEVQLETECVCTNNYTRRSVFRGVWWSNGNKVPAGKTSHAPGMTSCRVFGAGRHLLIMPENSALSRPKSRQQRHGAPPQPRACRSHSALRICSAPGSIWGTDAYRISGVAVFAPSSYQMTERLCLARVMPTYTSARNSRLLASSCPGCFLLFSQASRRTEISFKSDFSRPCARVRGKTSVTCAKSMPFML